MSVEDREALTGLQKREEIVIAPADKGYAVVFLDAEDYDRKVEDLIDNSPFRKVKKDTTRNIELKLSKHLWELHQKGAIDRIL